MPTVPSPAESPDPTLRHALKHVSRLFQSELRYRLAQHGVSEAEYMTLFALRRLPNMSSADLARWTGVSAQSANQVLKALIDAGLVERRSSSSHGRILEARLTRKGHRVIAACEEEADSVEQLMCSGMAPGEIDQFEELLRKAATGLGAPIGSGAPLTRRWHTAMLGDA